VSRQALIQRAEEARAWLLDSAFPLWADKGFDSRTGLFQEKLDAAGNPVAGPRRVRVQARQVFCYALAGRMGWSGPWRERVEAGFETLNRAARAEGGAVGHLLDVRGGLPDARRDLYDQAFAMFACAHAAPVAPQAAKRANEIADFIDHNWKQASGGYSDGEVEPAGIRRQNPHMHMLEASLALCAHVGAARWRPLAQSMYALFKGHFFEPNQGVLREFFDADWKPAPGEKGAILEPGHHFEWCWLLTRYAEEVGDDVRADADRLFDYGIKHGIGAHGLAMDEMLETGGVKSGGARLWPQTERLKAALVQVEQGGDPAFAVTAYDELKRYLDRPGPGLWADRAREDGSFVDEPSPASSFYHIALALDELIRVADI
jgi:mannose-6-phosphate isomerase